MTIAQIPMGHGICATRLQMTMAMCAIANEGVLMRPMLVDRLEDRDTRWWRSIRLNACARSSAEIAATAMVKALKTVATAEGTAPKAALEHYTVAGKTGTARKVENGVYVPNIFRRSSAFSPPTILSCASPSRSTSRSTAITAAQPRRPCSSRSPSVRPIT